MKHSLWLILPCFLASTAAMAGNFYFDCHADLPDRSFNFKLDRSHTVGIAVQGVGGGINLSAEHHFFSDNAVRWEYQPSDPDLASAGEFTAYKEISLTRPTLLHPDVQESKALFSCREVKGEPPAESQSSRIDSGNRGLPLSGSGTEDLISAPANR